MLKLPPVGIMTLVVALAALPAAAQQADQATTPPADSSAPAPGAPAGLVATVNNPNLAVAAVKLENGVRASKLIGATVYSDQNEGVGSVDDLIMTDGNKVTVVVVSVGGFLGLGSKLVAVPFDQLRRDADRVTLPGATKDTLNAMPNFVY